MCHFAVHNPVLPPLRITVQVGKITLKSIHTLLSRACG